MSKGDTLHWQELTFNLFSKTHSKTHTGRPILLFHCATKAPATSQLAGVANIANAPRLPSFNAQPPWLPTSVCGNFLVYLLSSRSCVQASAWSLRRIFFCDVHLSGDKITTWGTPCSIDPGNPFSGDSSSIATIFACLDFLAYVVGLGRDSASEMEGVR